MENGSKIKKLLEQQSVLAEFGSFAFRSNNLQSTLDKAVSICATYLNTPYCKICRFRPEEGDLLIVAGCGWKAGIVGHATSKADSTSPGGRAFITGEPVISPDLTVDEGFILPSFYADHNILATINVIIKGKNGNGAYGILEIDGQTPCAYEEEDVNFLTTFANVLAEAVETARSMERLRKALEDQEVLARELQHRVRNNLHLISNMLAIETEDPLGAEERLHTIANRVRSLATVYDHLLGSGMTRTMAFDKYLETLCANLADFQAGEVELIANQLVPLVIDLDTATALGLAVTELITNSYRHAFPDGKGTIEVTLNYRDQVPVISVQDNGIGLPKAEVSSRFGLGLVQQLVEQVEASIQLHQIPKGTRYEIELLAQAQAA